MAESFTKEALKMVVSQMCQAVGWHAIQTTSLEVLIDVLHRYLEELVKTSHLYADQFGRTRPNLDDLGLTFSTMGIEIRELEEYIEYVESVPCNFHVPKYPVAKESHLNFLKPGSKEVVTRPVHVHEHLPPTVPETEEGYLTNDNALAVDIAGPSATPSPQASPQGVFKRPGDPVDTPAAKRARLFLEEEGRPLREISSVMMTTGGFLSPAREGKLPEPKVVLPTSDSRSISPQPSSYPAVPPEVNREKKAKKVQEVSAKVEKKEKKKTSEKSEMIDETAIKKLASMKEMEKLKALKTGALKMNRFVPFQAKSPKPGSNKLLPPAEHSSEKSLIQKLSESPHLVVTPVQPSSKKQSPPSYEKTRDSGVTIAKLTTEPDIQKLNIFKKITKVKEEKLDKLEKHDFADVAPPTSKERSPGLIIEEVPSRKPRSALSEMMESLPKDKKEIRQVKTEPRTPDISQIYEDTLSSPGSPSTPKTPEIMRKVEKSPEHKKKKKDKEKKKKKGSPKERIKVEEDGNRHDRPKTPEIIEPSRLRDSMPTPVLPFFPHFPSGPSLIPPPISNPLIPRFPHPLVPNFPNLPLPPPLLMQQHMKSEDFKKDHYERMSDRAESSSPIKAEKEGKSPLAILLNREKKMKEHKKEKKDREKMKKKKEKKEKLKKEKGEKKHRDKEDKHKEHKSKEKKDKKIKKKEKLEALGAPMMVSVPKLTLKLGPSSPRPLSPDVKLKKLLAKPFKMDDEDKDVQQEKREPTPEIARISSLFNKPSKTSVTKPLHVQTEPSKGSSLSVPREQPPLMKSPGTIIDKDGNKVWICPACGRPDDGSAMIGCDECDAWYHWVCVGIQVPPDKNEDWYCRFCIVKKQGTHTEKKKRGRKKKPPV